MKNQKKISNTEEEHKKALASDDPTQVSQEDLENFAKEAMKKFKSMN